MSNESTDNVSREHGGAIDKPAVSGIAFLRPDTWQEAKKALLEGVEIEVMNEPVMTLLRAWEACGHRRSMLTVDFNAFSPGWAVISPHCRLTRKLTQLT
jgi:hypothetical protein